MLKFYALPKNCDEDDDEEREREKVQIKCCKIIHFVENIGCVKS